MQGGSQICPSSSTLKPLCRKFPLASKHTLAVPSRWKPAGSMRRSEVGFHSRRRTLCRIQSLPIEILPPLVGGELVEVLGVAVVSASAAFTVGRMTSLKQIEGKRAKTSANAEEQNSRFRMDEQMARPVPSAEEVWRSAWEGFNRVPVESTPKPRSKRQGYNNLSTSPGYSPFIKGQARLGIQALQPAARKRLLLLSLSSIHYSVSNMSESLRRRPSSEFFEAVAKMLVNCCSAVAKEWTGRAPDYGLQDSDLVQRLASEDRDEEPSKGMEVFNAWQGLFHLVKEKLPLHAVAVRYLRFGPDQQDPQGCSSDLTNPRVIAVPVSTTSQEEVARNQVNDKGGTRTALEAPTSVLPQQLSAYMDTSPDANNLGESGNLGTLEGYLQQASTALDEQETQSDCNGKNSSESVSSDIIMASSDIVQDMAVCVAEMVATFYLADIHAADKNGSQMIGQSWPSCLHGSIHSTRRLERFRNQVSLNWWFHRYVYSVVAIFEDYHWLWGFHQGSKIVQRKLSVRRSQDLLNLRRWRLLVSYLLEMLDALEPLGKHFFKRIGSLIAFLLTSLVGRAVGMVCKGVKSSLDGSPLKDTRPDQTSA